jgi:RimJ/RimL family protein N-acetyltransferase
MVKIWELETARSRLRQWRTEDFAPFAQMNADERVMAFFPSRLSIAQSNALATRLQGAIAQRGWGFWVMERRADQRFIGFVGLSIPTAALPFGPCVEIGWRLAFPYWGYGYATEAAEAALAFGFETLELEKIVSFTALKNVRSQAVMQRLNMQRSPQTFLHPSVPADSDLQEHCLYELWAAYWRDHTNCNLEA